MSDMSEAPNVNGSNFVESQSNHNFDLLSGVSVRVSVEVGSASLRLSELLKLEEGGVVELDRQANDMLEIFANGTLIAKGEIVTVDSRYGIRIAEVIAPERRLSGLERRS